MGDDKPWWFPVACDAAHFKQLRDDYPEDTASMSDEELHDHYDDGKKYPITWDTISDAYGEYEKLADAYLELLAKQATKLQTNRS